MSALDKIREFMTGPTIPASDDPKAPLINQVASVADPLAPPVILGAIKTPALRAAFGPRVREILDDPPALEKFAPLMKTTRDVRAQYVQDGKVIGNSRFDKYLGELPPEGTWAVDDVPGIHGREVAQLKRVDPKSLTPTENLPERMEDARRYAEWMKQGNRAPPLSVIETEKGNLHIIDGHRRWNAAQMAGQDVEAWIHPTGPHPGGLAAYGQTEPMRVGMTLEMLRDLLAKGTQ